MKPHEPHHHTGTCSRCGECCRWLPVVLVRQCRPDQMHYLRERGLREADGYFLADAPCRHLRKEGGSGTGAGTWSCEIYDRRPVTCREFDGRPLTGGKRYYVPDTCTLAKGT